MITFGRTATEPNFIFGKLPIYFKENDSYKDVNGCGLLERYFQIFCEEVDDNLSPYIDEVLDITNAELLSTLTRENPTELLIHISELFGNPPDVGTGQFYSGNETNYIRLLRYIKYILQTKGTRKSLEYYLRIYGYTIDTITDSTSYEVMYDASPTPLVYDDSHKYDDGYQFYSAYDLVITDLPGSDVKHPTQDWLNNYLKPSIQNFISPIFSTLGNLTYTT